MNVLYMYMYRSCMYNYAHNVHVKCATLFLHFSNYTYMCMCIVCSVVLYEDVHCFALCCFCVLFKRDIVHANKCIVLC